MGLRFIGFGVKKIRVKWLGPRLRESSFGTLPEDQKIMWETRWKMKWNLGLRGVITVWRSTWGSI